MFIHPLFFCETNDMKKLSTLFFCFLSFNLLAQRAKQDPLNIVIVTIDGIRWQEVFTGADKKIINDREFVADRDLLKAMYWAADATERRSKLMPFMWSVLANKGQIYGNRNYNNHVDVANRYKFSYPGYNEIFTGYTDKKFVPNTMVKNENTNVLEYLNQQAGYKGKVVAFSSWDVFPYILNEDRCGFPVNSGYESSLALTDREVNDRIDSVQAGIEEKSNTRLDALTYVNAKEYIKDKHPKVALVSFGEADHAAHLGHYDAYLQSMSNVDRMIADLWFFIQTDNYYKNNTILLVTTDHGRGRKNRSWTDHLFFVGGSKEIWMAIIGPEIAPLGEIKDSKTIYQKQIAATISDLLGIEFKSDNEIGSAIDISTNNTAPAITKAP